jgi:hypothetical protein
MACWDEVVAAIPAEGCHLLVQSDVDSVVVYQAFDESVASHAVKAGQFGGRAWRQDRCSAIRMSLLDVLHRSEWGRKPGKERILAIRLKRSGFDTLLRQAIHRDFPESLYESKRSWQLATRYGHVSLEWGPDRDLSGLPLPRQTGRIGMRDGALANFATQWIDEIIDLSDWARDNRGNEAAEVPTTAPYPVSDAALLEWLTYTEA